MTRKQRRKRRRRFFWRVRQIMFLTACIIIILAIGSTLYNTIRFHDTTKAERQVLKHQKEYPEELINFMKQNKEVDEFVENYTTYEGKHFKISLAGDYKEGNIPYLLQWDKRWGYETFDKTYFGISGSAPTCLSMVSVGLSKDLTSNPLSIARYIENNNYVSKDHKISSDFMTEGVEYFDITGTKITVNKKTMKQLLGDGSPLIAKLKEPVFMDREHYIVIYSTDEQGNFLIYDPNSKVESNKTHSFDSLKEEIDTIWSYTLL